MIKSDQFVIILGWMRNIPEIQSNNELLAYALIYGFSQTEGQYLTCKQSYIAAWLNITRANCNRIVKKLEKEGLVKKQLIKRHGAIKMYRYYAIRPTSAEIEHDECRNRTRASTETEHATSTETEHANNNINNNILYISSRQQQKKNQFCSIQQHDYDFEELERIALQKVLDNLSDEIVSSDL